MRLFCAVPAQRVIRRLCRAGENGACSASINTCQTCIMCHDPVNSGSPNLEARFRAVASPPACLAEAAMLRTLDRHIPHTPAEARNLTPQRDATRHALSELRRVCVAIRRARRALPPRATPNHFAVDPSSGRFLRAESGEISADSGSDAETDSGSSRPTPRNTARNGRAQTIPRTT